VEEKEEEDMDMGGLFDWFISFSKLITLINFFSLKRGCNFNNKKSII